MSVFVDTSAWYALLDEDDDNHVSAAAAWRRLLDTDAMATHAYVVVESSALVQRRLGFSAVERLHNDLLPAAVLWPVDAQTHARSVQRWLTARHRQLSLVDVTSFVMMGDRDVTTAFAYDDDFGAAGFSAPGLAAPGGPTG